MSAVTPLPPNLAELVAAYNDRDDAARRDQAVETIDKCRDELLVPILKQALAEKRSPDEFSTLCTLLGSILGNTGNAEAVALMKWLFERPKIQIWQFDSMLHAAWVSRCAELAPLIRPFFALLNGRYAHYAADYVETVKDDGAIDAILPMLDTPGLPRWHSMTALRAHPMFKKGHQVLLLGLCRAGVPEQAELIAEMGLDLYDTTFFTAVGDVRVCSAVLEYFERVGRADGPKERALFQRLASSSAWRPSLEDRSRLERLCLPGA
jgi:hypothetical protein